MHDCLSLCVSPLQETWISLCDSRDKLQLNHNSEMNKKRKWMYEVKNIIESLI